MKKYWVVMKEGQPEQGYRRIESITRARHYANTMATALPGTQYIILEAMELCFVPAQVLQCERLEGQSIAGESTPNIRLEP